MMMISRTKLILSLMAFLLLMPFFTSAHPGRTASDGCHYCRTNCDYWGEAWNERHCHGGYVAPAPVATKLPTPTPRATPNIVSGSNLARDAVLVKRVIDGDTIEVDISGVIKKVRFIGIDTPETVDPRKTVQCFGKEASNRTKELLMNKYVFLSTDTVGDTIDGYGRLLRYVRLIDKLESFNEQLIREGYAYAYTKYPFAKMADFVALQKSAKENGRGLWAPGVCDVPASPSATPTLQVAGVQEKKENWFIRFWKWVF